MVLLCLKWAFFFLLNFYAAAHVGVIMEAPRRDLLDLVVLIPVIASILLVA